MSVLRCAGRVAVFVVALVVVALTGAGEAHAQFTCANFFPTRTGVYGDNMQVTVSGVSDTATAHGVTGLHLGTSPAAQCTTYEMDQVVVRFDLQVVGVDPGERVSFQLNGAPYPIDPAQLLRNPDVTAQE